METAKTSLAVFDVFTVPPIFIYRYLIVFPISSASYYLSLPIRLVFRALSSIFYFFWELTGSFNVSDWPSVVMSTDQEQSSSCVPAAQSLLKFLLIAAIIGALSGYVLHLISRALASALGLRSTRPFKQEIQPASRSLADWREQRKQKQRHRIEAEDREGERELRSAPWTDSRGEVLLNAEDRVRAAEYEDVSSDF